VYDPAMKEHDKTCIMWQ